MDFDAGIFQHLKHREDSRFVIIDDLWPKIGEYRGTDLGKRRLREAQPGS